MLRGAIVSGLLHVLTIILVIVGMPWLFRPDDLVEAISVTMVTPADLAAAAAAPQPDSVDLPVPPPMPAAKAAAAEPAAEAPPPAEPPPTPDEPPAADAPPPPEPETAALAAPTPESARADAVVLPELPPAPEAPPEPETAAAPPEIPASPLESISDPNLQVDVTQAPEPPQPDQPPEPEPPPPEQLAEVVPPPEPDAPPEPETPPPEQVAEVAPPPEPAAPAEIIPPPAEPVAEEDSIPLPPVKPAVPDRPVTQVAEAPPPAEEPPADDFASSLISKLRDKTGVSNAAMPVQTAQVQPAALPQYTGIPVSQGEKDAIADYVGNNWLVLDGLEGFESMTFEVIVRLNPDGTVQFADVDRNSSNGHPNWEIAARAAIRAVFKSSPLPVPDKPYAAWAELRLVFHPDLAVRQ